MAHGRTLRGLQRRNAAVATAAGPSLQGKRMRAPGEVRSKTREDTHVFQNKESSSPSKRRKQLAIDLEAMEDDEPEREDSVGDEDKSHEQPWSQGYASASESGDSVDTDDAIQALEPLSSIKKGGLQALKKAIELDSNGEPYGCMKEVLEGDIKKYAKELNPICGWEGQPRTDRRRLFERLYSDWQMTGDSGRLSEKWMQPFITKVLINMRWRRNQCIDSSATKPGDVDPDVWKQMVTMRKTDAAQEKSEYMRSISKGKGGTTAQMKAIERQVVSRLTLLLKRTPFDPEVDAEVAKEYQRQQQQRRRARADHGTEIQEVRTRVADLEGSVERLGSKMAASQKRLEQMMQEILGNRRTSSTPVPDISAPTSQGTLAWQAAQPKFVVPMLERQSTKSTHAPVVADVPADVSIDASEDAEVNVNKDVVEDVIPEMEKQADVDVENLVTTPPSGQSQEKEDVYALVDGRGDQVLVTEQQTLPEMDSGEADVVIPVPVGGRARRGAKTVQTGKAAKTTRKSGASSKSSAEKDGAPAPPVGAQSAEKIGSNRKGDSSRRK